MNITKCWLFLKMYNILLVFMLFAKNNVLCDFLTEALHDVMTEPELAYYFQTSDKNKVPEYEVINLPSVLPVREATGKYGDQNEEILYRFSAFQRPINLKLRRNEGIVTPSFKTYVHDNNGINVMSHVPLNCHYLHRDEQFVAAFSICNPGTVQGMIFLDNATFEIHPLNERLQYLVQQPLVEEEGFLEEHIPHLVKRTNFPQYLHGMFPVASSVWEENHNVESNSYYDIYQNSFSHEVNSINPYRLGYTGVTKTHHMTLELAFFFDEAAYNIFAPHMNYDDKKLQDMLLAYMNGVQALYHHPSLGTNLDLVLVRLDIMKKQPVDMPHYEGERGKLLDSFCAYQEKINPQGDLNPDHWDMGLYVSGLDFFAYERGRKSGVTMGLATVGGVCYDKYACVIAEFGTTNVFGKPYPSAGFTSVYILAHEIGHNLGMHHDSSGNSCPKEGYIMSPSRGTNGETQWSRCSADVMSKLGWAKCLQDSARPPKSIDHSHFQNSPGQVFTAKRQCEILLRDKDAVVAPNQQLSAICYNLQCKTPHRSGYYFAGPALDGTMCGSSKYCYGGDCTDKKPPKPSNVVPGGWGPWKEGVCKSGCIENSRGSSTKKRFCNNPTPVNTDQGCEGHSVDIGTCNDNNICRSGRRTAVEYASMKCKEFANVLPELDGNGAGLQSPHEEGRIWMGCAIFCKRSDSGTYYTPRIELNDLGVSPYFPDGTWCHKDKSNIDYYCIQHHCLPETFKFTKTDPFSEMGDIPIPQNARPLPSIPQHIKDYFSLGPDGKPLQTMLRPMDTKPPKDEDWETEDYIIVPELQNRHKQLIHEESYDDLNYVSF